MTVSPASRWGAILLPVTFIALTVYFLLPDSGTSESEQVEPLHQVWYRVETARADLLENKSIVGNCHLCHAFWVPIPTSTQTSNPRFAHANITAATTAVTTVTRLMTATSMWPMTVQTS